MKLRVLVILLLAGCAPAGPSARTLHEVDGEVVYSDPPAPAAYEAYIRAALLLERDPPDPEAALRHLDQALRYDPAEPQLHVARARALALLGDETGARQALARALELSPEYLPAREALATLGDTTEKTVSRDP